MSDSEGPSVADWVELTGDDLPYHLRPDAQGTTCSSCGRTTWSADEFEQVCNMPQPDGSRCQGRFGTPPDAPSNASRPTTPEGPE